MTAQHLNISTLPIYLGSHTRGAEQRHNISSSAGAKLHRCELLTNVASRTSSLHLPSKIKISHKIWQKNLYARCWKVQECSRLIPYHASLVLKTKSSCWSRTSSKHQPGAWVRERKQENQIITLHHRQRLWRPKQSASQKDTRKEYKAQKVSLVFDRLRGLICSDLRVPPWSHNGVTARQGGMRESLLSGCVPVVPKLEQHPRPEISLVSRLVTTALKNF